MILQNFAHPVAADQAAGVERLAGRWVDRVLDVPTQFDHDRPFADQAADLVGRAG